jgi:hypothetical protein
MQAFGSAVESEANQKEMFVAEPQQLEIRFLGTSIRANGVVGIVGAVALVGIILVMYIRN